MSTKDFGLIHWALIILGVGAFGLCIICVAGEALQNTWYSMQHSWERAAAKNIDLEMVSYTLGDAPVITIKATNRDWVKHTICITGVIDARVPNNLTSIASFGNLGSECQTVEAGAVETVPMNIAYSYSWTQVDGGHPAPIQVCYHIDVIDNTGVADISVDQKTDPDLPCVS